MIKNKIESPYTNGQAILKKELKTRTFRKDNFQIWEHYYVCEKTKKEFTTTEIDELNIGQIYNQYREKYGFLFPKQIKSLRENYGLNISQLSKILGVGINMIRNYENGEMPSTSNATLLNMVKKPKVFRALFLEKTTILSISEKKKKEVLRNIEILLEQQTKNEKRCLPMIDHPNEFTGYQVPNFEKLAHMTIFFLENLNHLFRVKLNKLLFYSDFLFFKENGKSISGIQYAAIPMGPVPERYNHLYGSMIDEDYLSVKEIPSEEFEQFLEKMIPVKKFDEAIFSIDEIEVLKTVLEKLGYKSRKEIVAISHNEKCWQDLNEEKKRISYQKYAFELGGV